MKELSLVIKSIKDYAILVLNGELGISGSQEFKAKISEMIEQGHKKIAIDLSNMSLVGSIGLSSIIRSHQLAVSKGVDFRILCPSGYIHEIFKATGTDSILNLHTDQAEFIEKT